MIFMSLMHPMAHWAYAELPHKRKETLFLRWLFKRKAPTSLGLAGAQAREEERGLPLTLKLKPISRSESIQGGFL